MIKRSFIVTVCCIALLSAGSPVRADEVYLKNGDRITGTVDSETADTVIVTTEAMGVLSLTKEHIDKVIKEGAAEVVEVPVEEKKKSDWRREIALGYTDSRGNTEASEFSGSILANKKTDADEITIKANSYYSSQNKKMDGQKWAGLLRYAMNFPDSPKWFGFAKLETDHDKFASIDYRLIPSAGTGYWFWDRDDLKLMVEGSLGLEHTEYSDNTEKTDEFIGVLRGYFEKKLFEKIKFTEDASLYPSFGDFGEFRLRYEAALINPVSENLSLKFSFIDDYNSDAPAGKKKNDTQFISSLVYSF